MFTSYGRKQALANWKTFAVGKGYLVATSLTDTPFPETTDAATLTAGAVPVAESFFGAIFTGDPVEDDTGIYLQGINATVPSGTIPAAWTAYGYLVYEPQGDGTYKIILQDLFPASVDVPVGISFAATPRVYFDTV